MQRLKQTSISSKRLFIAPLNVNDNAFVLALFNTPGWLQFIGDRNLKNVDDATHFINKYLENENAAIWTFCVKENHTEPLGIITLIKRDFLDFPDIGYAVLPKYMQQGLAYEATLAVLDLIMNEQLHKKIYAMTLPENKASVNLLNKLNFSYNKELVEKDELLHIYSVELLK